MRSQLSRGRRMQTLGSVGVLLLVLEGGPRADTPASPAQAQADQVDQLNRLMTKGKLEADLGRYDRASEAFSTIAGDGRAPAALQWEAHVRLGLARSAAGDARGGTAAFRKVRATFGGDPAAMRFLLSAVASASPGKVWVDFKAEFEELLRSARVVSAESLGMLVSGPKKLHLQHGEIELDAAWKPGGNDSIGEGRAEPAAYELDKILELDMVPPAVRRAVDGQDGSIQLWVNGCRIFKDVVAAVPKTPDWSNQLSRMQTFDALVGNADRNQGNILVDQDWQLVLIDHSRSFSPGRQTLGDLPGQFDRRLVQKLRGLTAAGLGVRLEGLLTPEEIRGLLLRRDALLNHIESFVSTKGEADILF